MVGTILFSFFGAEPPFLDYGGGYGLFTRMMRDAGFDFFWQDRYSSKLFARGFEYDASSGAPASLTAFELFEHLADPRVETQAMRQLSPNVVFSTLLLPEPVPPAHDWWYYALEHGQHVSFYTEAALEHLAREGGATLATNRSDLHMFLDPALIPRRVAAGWFERWQPDQSASVGRLLSTSYELVSHTWPPGGVRQRIRNAYQRRQDPGLYWLRAGIGSDALAKLAASGIGKAYANHLLLHGAQYWERITAHLQPRTMGDMLSLRDRILLAESSVRTAP
ncbi:MAG: class I SAM-dependent methyltransferase [Gemmatimonadaceae bacterium]|nr:class I SAM-dependent methyltransferase [Gemmatimonadaceae bacterium]MDQ3242896.1 class I SAM-dependent methyltransferase [Gemmatimonadota bacterium]